MDDTAVRTEAARVLVADDDPLVRQLAFAAMRAEGLEVDEAADGEETLLRAARVEPDLILLDVRMPRKDGFAVLESLHCDPKMRDVPVLVMTGCDDHDSIEHAYRAGATDFIVKPIQWTILRHRVRYLIRASAQLLQLQRSERALAAAQRIAQLGSWSLDFDGTFTCSEEIPRIFGAAPEVRGEALLELMKARVHPEDLRLIEHCLRDAARETHPYTTDYRLVLPNGERRHVHMEARGIRDERGSTLADIAPGPMSVNVSPQLFRDGQAADLVEKVLAETSLDPAYLEIEITENALLEETDAAAAQLRRLRSQGVRIAIDDFGTGYSSLRYLSHLELDTLKIDRSLIEHLGSDLQSGLIIDALVSMCVALGLNMVAEGVETETQLDALRERGCKELQGFLISRAVPASEFERLLWP